MKEVDIRPDELFEEYLRLAKEDCEKFFENSKKFDFNCPIHPSIKGSHIFIKNGFFYNQCTKCKSIYNSPRNLSNNFEKFYLNGKSVKFWSEEFYKKTEVSRKKNLWEPKVNDLCMNKILKHPIQNYSIIDIGGGYGVFGEIIKIKKPKNLVIIEPNKNLANICRKKGINVIEKFFAKNLKKYLPSGLKIFTSFELIEHLYDPRDFFLTLRGIMDKGDILYMTTLTSSGLDIKELKENSKSVSPPHHINFLSIEGIEELLQKENYEEIKITTPGKLDLDILKKNKKFIKDGFLLDIINKFSNESINELQKLISKNNMSSHMLITARL